MDKRGTVIESIQKLVALGVSDREIAENLYDVGIERTEAVSLIDEAKKDLPQSSQTSTNTAQNNSQSSSQTQAVSSNQTSSSQQVLSQNQKSKEPIFDEAQGLSMDEQVVRQLPIDKKNISEGDSAGASDSIEEGASDSDELENEAKDLG
ncbi:MAG: hypothetical protein NTY48_05050, partial [Candidatus Diapherotrites archaeon]|nr:hypothetical protein [Candidatus Diapherotrites archaeon]